MTDSVERIGEQNLQEGTDLKRARSFAGFLEMPFHFSG